MHKFVIEWTVLSLYTANVLHTHLRFSYGVRLNNFKRRRVFCGGGGGNGKRRRGRDVDPWLQSQVVRTV